MSWTIRSLIHRAASRNVDHPENDGTGFDVEVARAGLDRVAGQARLQWAAIKGEDDRRTAERLLGRPAPQRNEL